MDHPAHTSSSAPQATRGYLAAREAAADALASGSPATQVAAELSAAARAWITALWHHLAPSPVREATALVALGGFGRGHMCFGSDLDLMIEVLDPTLVDDGTFAEAVEQLMTSCRAARVTLGHSVRTTAQALDALAGDPRTPISLLDARALPHPGMGKPSRDWAQAAADFLRGDDHGEAFIERLIEGYRQRRARHGRTVYLLEPDIKSGDGGLRDLNYLAWAARVRFGLDLASHTDRRAGWHCPQQAQYITGLDWLLALRHRLHLAHGRKHDRLNFPDQEALAADLLDADRRPQPHRLVEALMRKHYSLARAISMLTQRHLRRWRLNQPHSPRRVHPAFSIRGGQLALRDAASAGVADDAVLDALTLAAEHHVLLDPVLELTLAEHVASWNLSPRRRARLSSRLSALLTDPETSARTSERLLQIGILPALIPELEPIICHVQHDVYHVYTTDTHSLKCLELGRRLISSRHTEPSWPFFERVAAKIQDSKTFLLACLFHDIGKNRGGDHSRIGAELMALIGSRLGLDDQQIDQLAFLVREHLTLSDTARRRDTADPKVIRDLAARVRTLESLNQLTALTFCDMSTVAPRVMSDWNASLLIDLHERLRRALAHGVESLWRDRRAALDTTRAGLLALAAEQTQLEDGALRSRVDEFIRDMPTDHLINHRARDLIRPFHAYHQARASQQPAIIVTPLPERGVTEWVVATHDVPGTLAKIAGTLATNGLDIKAAEITTSASGISNDVFQVSRPARRSDGLAPPACAVLDDLPRINRVRQQLHRVLCGEADVAVLLDRHLTQRKLLPRPAPAVTSSVRVHQDQSDNFTVVEVRALDRPGLLYTISKTLWEAGVSTHLSKIDSLGNQAIDTFYVEGLRGGKLAEDEAARVVEALEHTLSDSPLI